MKSYFKTSLIVLVVITCISCYSTDPALKNKEKQENTGYAFVIHGGAGTITKSSITNIKEKSIRIDLNKALDAGEEILENGGKAVDAVEAAILILEDSPNFNAGKGAVFTHAGINEMDASIMLGQDLSAGAVGGVNQCAKSHPRSSRCS